MVPAEMMSSLLVAGGWGSVPVRWLLLRYSSWMASDWTRQAGMEPSTRLAACGTCTWQVSRRGPV